VAAIKDFEPVSDAQPGEGLIEFPQFRIIEVLNPDRAIKSEGHAGRGPDRGREAGTLWFLRQTDMISALRALWSAAPGPVPYTNFYRGKQYSGDGGPFRSAATGRRLPSPGQPQNWAACRPAARSAEHHRRQQGCGGESRRQAAGMRHYRAPQSGDQSPHSRRSRPRLDDGEVSR